jgi:hypothetical protein
MAFALLEPGGEQDKSAGAGTQHLLATDNRFVFGLYRRYMKVNSYLGRLDRLFGVPATTRNWNTITAIARVLERPAGPGRAVRISG